MPVSTAECFLVVGMAGIAIMVSTEGPLQVPKPLEELSAQEIRRKLVVADVMSRTLGHLTRHFTREGFCWMLPVVFSKSTDPLWPDPNASIEKRVEVEIYGETVRTMQSMIMHKLVACSLAYPKLFLLSPNTRIEKKERSRTGRHTYEFTQLDFEMRGASSRQVMRLVEGALLGLASGLKKVGGMKALGAVKAPFETHDRRELEKLYGASWEEELTARLKRPAWVTNLPREFYDFEDMKTGVWDNYDLFVPGFGEILSGARREWEYKKILGKIERDGVKKENYELVLRLAEAGRLKPTAGGGIGIERLVCWLTGTEHIGAVQPFPKVPGYVNEL